MKQPLTPLAQLAEFVRGITFKPDDVTALASDSSVACMRTKNVQEHIDLIDVWAVHESFMKRADQLLRPGDILVSSANSWNLVGKCCWVPVLPWRATWGGFITCLRADQRKLDPRYLYHWFASPQTQAEVRACGRQTTNISNLDLNRCLALEIPLPPLAEQRRIAAILDHADALRAKRRAAIAKLDSLAQAIFLEMFGDLRTNPKKHVLLSLGSVCTRVTDGTHQPPKWSDDGVPFLFVSNIRDGAISFATEKFVSIETYKELTRRCPIELYDILYTTVGSYGNAALVRDERPFAFQRHIAHIKPNYSEFDPHFFAAMLQSPSIRSQADSLARGVAQKTLNLSDLKAFTVMKPPLEQQRAFAFRMSTLEELKSGALKSARAHETLFSAVQHRAFQGDL